MYSSGLLKTVDVIFFNSTRVQRAAVSPDGK